MTIDADWGEDRDRLIGGYHEEERAKLKALLDEASAKAKAGELAAAAAPLESARQFMVTQNQFFHADSHIWVFADVIRAIRRQSPEEKVPKPFQKFLDAIPSAKMDAEMSRSQKMFWYGNPDMKIHGEISLVGPDPNKKCFIATAACGSETSWEVESLRAFRDRSLLPTRLGRRSVEAYYRVSPPLARLIESRAGLRGMIRRLLVAPLARITRRT